MSALCGVIRFGGAPVDAAELGAMRGAIAHWGADGGGTWVGGSAGFAQLIAHRTPEARHERGPLVTGNGSIVTAAARLDNRDQLLDEFELPDAGTPDSVLIARAYERWQEEAPLHLLRD